MSADSTLCGFRQETGDWHCTDWNYNSPVGLDKMCVISTILISWGDIIWNISLLTPREVIPYPMLVTLSAIIVRVFVCSSLKFIFLQRAFPVISCIQIISQNKYYFGVLVCNLPFGVIHKNDRNLNSTCYSIMFRNCDSFAFRGTHNRSDIICLSSRIF